MEIYEIVNMYNSTLIEDFILRIKQVFMELSPWCVLVTVVLLLFLLRTKMIVGF